MNPGKLKNRIEVLTTTKTADGYGGFTGSTSTDATVWGFAKEKKGEFIMGDGSRKKYKEVEVVLRKKSFDLIDDTDFTFKIDGSSPYRVNDVYESQIDKYITITGTLV